jgi:hypothetical protein
VTLYVAAPGSELVDEGTDAAQVESGPEPGAVASVASAQADAASAPARARRRKPGRARQAPAVFDAPLEPAPLDRASASELPTPVLAQPAAEPPRECLPEPDNAPLDDIPSVEPAPEARSHGEFVVHAEDVLAGRRGPSGWRGVYPRRRADRELAAGRGCSCTVAPASPGVQRCGRGGPARPELVTSTARNVEQPRLSA